MHLITAVVPTLNRPTLLWEALQSLAAQSRRPDEIIVVDDGSVPAVDAVAIAAEFGAQVRVLRNERSKGLAYARNWGVEQARSKYVVHLDDDDLFAPETLAEGLALLQSDPDLEVVFLGVAGFGPWSEHYNRVQPEANRKVCERVPDCIAMPGRVYFGRGLIGALLLAVPAAFQHTMLSRATWEKVSRLRRRAYQIGTGANDDEGANALIVGKLRDSEWALYAAAICDKTVLLDSPRYLFRCEGQNFASNPANKEHHALQGLGIKWQLYRAACLPDLAHWQRDIRNALATAEIDLAYQYFMSGRRILAWKHAWRSLAVRPSFAAMRFIGRICLPRPNEGPMA